MCRAPPPLHASAWATTDQLSEGVGGPAVLGHVLVELILTCGKAHTVQQDAERVHPAATHPDPHVTQAR